MSYKQRAAKILLASLLTIGFAYVFIMLTSGITSGYERAFGYRFGLVLSLIVSMLIMVAAGIPALSIRSLWTKVPHGSSITLFATIEAFWLSFALAPATISFLGWWAWLPSKLILIVLAYFGADALFNIWTTRFRYKAISAVGIILLTMLIGNLF